MTNKQTSRTKTYNNFRMYLERVHKIKNACSIAHFLIEKFVNTKNPTGYIKIYLKELEQAGIVSKKSQFKKMYEFRDEMCKKFILQCKADGEELNDKDPNFKAAEFKFGYNSKKYIESALHEKASVFERLDSKVDIEDLDILEKRMNDKIQQAATIEQVNDLQSKLHDLEYQMEKMLLLAFPPDNEEGRILIKENKVFPEECLKKLKERTNNYSQKFRVVS